MNYCAKFINEKSSVETTFVSKMNSFDYNSMKLGHIIKYHNVFKFQNGPYRIMPSGVIALFNDNSLILQ